MTITPSELTLRNKLRDGNHLPSSDNPIKWQSMTGVDMVAVFRFDNLKHDPSEDVQIYYKIFAEVQTISVSGTRSIHPVRCLGESTARAYTRGARTIAGTIIFTMFDRDPLEEVSRLDWEHETFNGREPFFIDQIPEFDIIITSVNEMGAISRALIGGCTLTNYGTTFSIHDIYTEISNTYVARWYIPMTPDLKAFDKIRKLLVEPSPKAASEKAEKQMNSRNDPDEEFAKKVLEKYDEDSNVGSFIRNYERK